MVAAKRAFLKFGLISFIFYPMLIDETTHIVYLFIHLASLY